MSGHILIKIVMHFCLSISDCNLHKTGRVVKKVAIVIRQYMLKIITEYCSNEVKINRAVMVMSINIDLFIHYLMLLTN